MSTLTRLHKQLYHHDPKNGVWGDCHRAAYAALFLLDPEEVPHFGDKGASTEEFNKAVDDWLRKLGYRALTTAYPAESCTLDAVLSTVEVLNPGVAFLLGGQSKNGVNHTVVCRRGEILHDPALDNSGIVGPCDDGYFWVTYVGTLLPLEELLEEAA